MGDRFLFLSELFYSQSTYILQRYIHPRTNEKRGTTRAGREKYDLRSDFYSGPGSGLSVPKADLEEPLFIFCHPVVQRGNKQSETEIALATQSYEESAATLHC